MIFWQTIREWILQLGSKYHVDPWVFGTIYVGAIPFFFASLWWLVRNLKAGKPVVLPILATGFCFVSAYLYLLIVGRNIPFWVYILIVALVGYGVWSTIRSIRKKLKRS